MRIPAEVVSPYINEGDNKAFAEDKKAGPIENPARLRATLPHSSQEPRQAVDEGKPAVDEGRERSPLRNRRSDRPVSKERRLDDPRKEQIPVLLDTRLTRCRRASSHSQAINFRI